MPRILLLSVICLTALLQGCPKPWIITCYNNSGRSVIILLPKENIVWKAGAVVEISDRKGSVGFNQLTQAFSATAGGTVPLLMVSDNAITYEYALVWVELPRDVIEYSNGFNKVYFQLESDGKLYAVKPSTAEPYNRLIPQPAGFPIMPVRRH